MVAVNGETDHDNTDDAIHETKKMSEYTNGNHYIRDNLRVIVTSSWCAAGVDIPGSVDSNPLDKAQLPPIAGPPSPPGEMTNGRPKTSNPNFR